MAGATSQSRWTGRRIVIVAVGLLVIIGALAVWPIAVVYHSRQLERWRVVKEAEHRLYLSRVRAGVFLSPSNSEALRSFYHHRQRLVELGAIRHKCYRLKHLKVGSEEYMHLLQAATTLPCLEMTGVYTNKVKTANVDVHSVPSDAAEWDRFIAERDVPDYREKFMIGVAGSSDGWSFPNSGKAEP